jgi:hypothetical protein
LVIGRPSAVVARQGPMSYTGRSAERSHEELKPMPRYTLPMIVLYGLFCIVTRGIPALLGLFASIGVGASVGQPVYGALVGVGVFVALLAYLAWRAHRRPRTQSDAPPPAARRLPRDKPLGLRRAAERADG